MGNCIESFKLKYNQETEMNQQEAEPKTNNDEMDEKSGKMRVKIVLTKEELDWLFWQLESKQGKSLEDVLGEIEKSRGKALLSVYASSSSAAVWKPSLDSIVESPEVPETMDR